MYEKREVVKGGKIVSEKTKWKKLVKRNYVHDTKGCILFFNAITLNHKSEASQVVEEWFVASGR